MDLKRILNTKSPSVVPDQLSREWPLASNAVSREATFKHETRAGSPLSYPPSTSAATHSGQAHQAVRSFESSPQDHEDKAAYTMANAPPTNLEYEEEYWRNVNESQDRPRRSNDSSLNADAPGSRDSDMAGPKPYPCPYAECGKSFARRSDLARHGKLAERRNVRLV